MFSVVPTGRRGSTMVAKKTLARMGIFESLLKSFRSACKKLRQRRSSMSSPASGPASASCIAPWSSWSLSAFSSSPSPSSAAAALSSSTTPVASLAEAPSSPDPDRGSFPSPSPSPSPSSSSQTPSVAEWSRGTRSVSPAGSAWSRAPSAVASPAAPRVEGTSTLSAVKCATMRSTVVLGSSSDCSAVPAVTEDASLFCLAFFFFSKRFLFLLRLAAALRASSSPSFPSLSSSAALSWRSLELGDTGRSRGKLPRKLARSAECADGTADTRGTGGRKLLSMLSMRLPG
mmetsp:Transcript_9587/g.35897  ORF Transcript_9587/g.35897 Transcript_9587/m.35897 type:complete len:288 (-) Transcript_9587:2016-2879(-)